jgi:hypothetical protein
VELRREIVANGCVISTVMLLPTDLTSVLAFLGAKMVLGSHVDLSVLPVLFPGCLKSEAEAF